MSNHTNNWAVTATVTTPSGTVLPSVLFGRTRSDARKASDKFHADAPHGFRVRTSAPRKLPVV